MHDAWAEPPWFEDLPVGAVLDTAPSITLTAGHAAVHQAITGDRLRLALDAELGIAVAGEGPPVAHPALVWDTAIGQSTLATGRVVANLFYRDLALRRIVRIGDSLRTATTVVARRENRVKEGRAPTGLALLRIRTVDQHSRPVLDFVRCAMLPLRDAPRRVPGDDLGGTADLDEAALRDIAGTLELEAFRQRVVSWEDERLVPGWSTDVAGGDVVDSAPALARLTLNTARVHLDATGSVHGRRLVYGGHTIGLAAAQVARAVPSLVMILGWHTVEHTAPVFEGDTLRSTVAVERRTPLPGGGALLDLRSRVTAVESPERGEEQVLDWRFVGLVA